MNGLVAVTDVMRSFARMALRLAYGIMVRNVVRILVRKPIT